MPPTPVLVTGPPLTPRHHYDDDGYELRRDSGARLFRLEPDSVRRTLQPSQPSILIVDVWLPSLAFLTQASLARFATLCADAARLVHCERQRRRRRERDAWRRASDAFRAERAAALERRRRLPGRLIATLDRQLAASIAADHVTRALVLVEFGAQVAVPVNLARIARRVLDEDAAAGPRLVALARVALRAGPDPAAAWAGTDGARRQTAFDLLVTDGVARRPWASTQVLALLAAAGYRIPAPSLPYWTAFADADPDGGVGAAADVVEARAVIVRMAVDHNWFDLDGGVLGDGSWNRFPHALLGARPNRLVVGELLAAAQCRWQIWARDPDRARRLDRRLRQHGQSAATVIEYWERFPQTRRLLRAVLLRAADLRRLVLAQWPQVLVHLYDCHDLTTLRLLYDLEPDLVTSVVVDAHGNTWPHHVARLPNRIAERCAAMIGAVVAHRNADGETAQQVAERLGHRLPFDERGQQGDADDVLELSRLTAVTDTAGTP